MPSLQWYRYQSSKSFSTGLLRKKSEGTDKKKSTKQKVPTETCPDLIKEYVHGIVRDSLVYVSENSLMEYTGEAEIHENKNVLH